MQFPWALRGGPTDVWESDCYRKHTCHVDVTWYAATFRTSMKGSHMTKPTNLSHGRGYLAIPGPSVMPDAVLSAMHRAAPNIYAGELIDMMPPLMADLKRVARTQHHVAMYIGNGHAVWEAALANVIAPGDTVLVPATGRFGIGWGEMAEGLGAHVQLIDFGLHAPMDMARVAEALAADKDHKIKAVLGVHVDTSTSIRNDIAALRATLDAEKHPALLMADCIASMGCDVFEMDAWGVDVAVTGCQKGLMVPPGTSFVFFNHKADAARGDMARVSRFWDWRPRANAEEFYQYHCGTAPTHHIYGYDPAWHGFFRLGHMGHVNGHMILGMLGGIEAGLRALKIDHGAGALDAAAQVIAGG